MMSPSRCLAIVALALSVSSAFAQQTRCSDSEAQRAETVAEMLRSWDALYRSYKLFRQCDDGSIGEGYSESVARILVDHWNTLSQLSHLAKKDAEFRAFVMKHVDATLNMEDVEKIKQNANTRCPIGLLMVCGDLA